MQVCTTAPVRPSLPAGSVTPLLSCRGFGAAFGSRVAFDALDFDVEAGGVTVLGGPVGSGKSSLLYTLAGLSQRNSRFRGWGEARFLGQPLGTEPLPLLVRPDARMLQSVVQDVLGEAARLNCVSGPAPRHVRLQEELEKFGLPEFNAHLSSRAIQLPRELRLALPILVSMLRRAPLLLLDEPTARLDEAEAQFMLGVLQAASRHCTVLAAIADERHAALVATQQLVLQEGRLQPAHTSAPGTVPSEASAAAATAGSEPVLPEGFSWVLPGRLAGMPLRSTAANIEADLAALKAAGINALVTLTKTGIPAEVLKRQGLSNLHLPVRDGEPPTVAQTNMLLIRMRRMLERGRTQAVHCSDGTGRTGTVLAAWLIREEGLSAWDAMERLRAIDPRFVQSAEQEHFLHEYEISLFKNRK